MDQNTLFQMKLREAELETLLKVAYSNEEDIAISKYPKHNGYDLYKEWAYIQRQFANLVHIDSWIIESWLEKFTINDLLEKRKSSNNREFVMNLRETGRESLADYVESAIVA